MNFLKKYDDQFDESDVTATRHELADVKRQYKRNCEYIEANIGRFPFPSYEICVTMQSSFKLLHFIANKFYLVDQS